MKMDAKLLTIITHGAQNCVERDSGTLDERAIMRSEYLSVFKG